MTICKFIRINHNTLKCISCGNTLNIIDNNDSPPIFPCFGILKSPLNTTLSDADAIKKEAASLAPSDLDTDKMCTAQQVLDRYKVCGSCEFFDNNTCTKCGCLLSRDRIFMSKLSWKDAECPEGKWTKLD